MYTSYQPLLESVGFYIDRARQSDKPHRLHFPLVIVCDGLVLLQDTSTIESPSPEAGIVVPQKQIARVGNSTRYEKPVRNHVGNNIFTNKIDKHCLNIEPLGIVKFFSSDHNGEATHTVVTQIPTVVGLPGEAFTDPHSDYRHIRGETFWTDYLDAFASLNYYAQSGDEEINTALDARDIMACLLKRTTDIPLVAEQQLEAVS